MSINKSSLILPKIEPQIKPQVQQSQISVKEKLKSLILKVPSDQQPTDDSIEKKIILGKPQLVKSSGVKFVSKVKNNSNKEDMEERNRFAARRYRDKKKIEQTHILKLNASLKLENSLLKQKLKDFELAHKNCSVSMVEQTSKPVLYLLTKLPNCVHEKIKEERNLCHLEAQQMT